MPRKSKKSPKPSNLEPPKLTVKDGKLIGWEEHDIWQRNNNALWASAHMEAQLLGLGSEDRVRLLAYHFGSCVSKMIELDVQRARKESGGSMIFPLRYDSDGQ